MEKKTREIAFFLYPQEAKICHTHARMSEKMFRVNWKKMFRVKLIYPCILSYFYAVLGDIKGYELFWEEE